VVGRKASELNTGLAAHLLARLDSPVHQAEASLHPGRPSRLGLRLLFPGEEGWRACAAELGLPSTSLDLDARLREHFELVPDVWLRLRFDGPRLSAFSLNYVVMPHLRYPVTTLRLALRRSGLPPQFDVEPLLAVVLRETGTQWGFSLRWEDESIAEGRIFGRFPRSMLGQVLESLRAGSYMDDNAARLYAEWDARVVADRSVYLSLDPRRAGRLSVDFERVPTHRLPPDLWQPAVVEPPPFASLAYLKCRLDEAGRPSWTAYAPWWQLKLWWEMGQREGAPAPQNG
jgi:hypothetical protein